MFCFYGFAKTLMVPGSRTQGFWVFAHPWQKACAYDKLVCLGLELVLVLQLQLQVQDTGLSTWHQVQYRRGAPNFSLYTCSYAKNSLNDAKVGNLVYINSIYHVFSQLQWDSWWWSCCRWWWCFLVLGSVIYPVTSISSSCGPWQLGSIAQNISISTDVLQ